MDVVHKTTVSYESQFCGSHRGKMCEGNRETAYRICVRLKLNHATTRIIQVHNMHAPCDKNEEKMFYGTV